MAAATGSAVILHTGEVIEEVLPESAMCRDLERSCFGVVELDVSEVCVLQYDGSSEDFIQERLDLRRRQEAGAERVQVIPAASSSFNSNNSAVRSATRCSSSSALGFCSFNYRASCNATTAGFAGL
jgi:hypothetical protein